MTSPIARPDEQRRGALAVAICCFAGIGEGFDAQSPGVTIAAIAPAFSLATGEGGGVLAGALSERSLFLGASVLGMLIGAVIGGRLADIVGRKRVAMISVALFGIVSALTALSNSVEGLLWTRFATGLGLGGALPTLLTMAAEAVNERWRNTAVGCLYASLPVGGAVASLVSVGSAGEAADWRTVYFVGALLPLLAVPAIAFGVSDVAVTRNRQSPEARTSIAHALTGEQRLLQTALLWLCFLLALLASYLLLSWLPTLLIARGLSKADASLVQLAYNLAGVGGGVLAGLLTDRLGRTRSVPVFFLCAIAALALLAGVPADFAVSMLAGALVGVSVLGTQSIVYALAPSVYPASIRGTGVGFAVSIGRIGALLGPLFAGALLGAGLSASQVLAILVPLMLVEGAAAWRLSRLLAGKAPATSASHGR